MLGVREKCETDSQEIYLHMCVYMCVCVYIYIYIYIYGKLVFLQRYTGNSVEKDSQMVMQKKEL